LCFDCGGLAASIVSQRCMHPAVMRSTRSGGCVGVPQPRGGTRPVKTRPWPLRADGLGRFGTVWDRDQLIHSSCTRHAPRAQSPNHPPSCPGPSHRCRGQYITSTANNARLPPQRPQHRATVLRGCNRRQADQGPNPLLHWRFGGGQSMRSHTQDFRDRGGASH
jgi:hypothetical protein